MQRLQPTATAVPVTGPEVEELLRLALEEERPEGSVATTADIAEALRMPESDVIALLERVRQRSAVAVPEVDPRELKGRDLRRTWAAAFVGLIVFSILAGALLLELSRERRGIAPPAPVSMPSSTVVDVTNAPTKMGGPEAPFTPVTFTLGGTEYPITGMNSTSFVDSVERAIEDVYRDRLRVPAAEVRQIMADPNLAGERFVQMPIDVLYRTANGTRLRIPERTVPVFVGDSIEVEQRVRAARQQILAKAFGEMMELSQRPTTGG